MDIETLAGILLFGFPVWLAIVIWVLVKIFRIHTLFD
jgi:hypothetical protein